MFAIPALILIAAIFGWSRHSELNRFNRIVTELNIKQEDII